MPMGASASNPVHLDPFQNIIRYNAGGPCTLLILTIEGLSGGVIPKQAFIYVLGVAKPPNPTNGPPFALTNAVGTSSFAVPGEGDFPDVDYGEQGGRRAVPWDPHEFAPYSYIGPPSNPSTWEPNTVKDKNAQISAQGALFYALASGTTGASEPAWNTTPGNTTPDNNIQWMCKNYKEDWEVWFVGDPGGENSGQSRKWIIKTNSFIEQGTISIEVWLSVGDPFGSDVDEQVLKVEGYRGQGTIKVNGNNVTYAGPNVRNFFKATDTVRAKFKPTVTLFPRIDLTVRLRRRKDEEPCSFAGGTPLPPASP